MAKRKLGKVVVKKGRKPGESDLQIPIAADLLKVEGIPIRDNEVSYYSREFPLESFSVLESASAIWADGERQKHSPEINDLILSTNPKFYLGLRKLLTWVIVTRKVLPMLKT